MKILFALSFSLLRRQELLCCDACSSAALRHVGVFNLTENWRKKKSSNAILHLQVFDLKGSLRNRNVKTDTGKESCDVVLLDENLLKMVRDNPLYIRSHCKAVLRASIHSDSQFLSSHLIIDYSLLVGRDDTNNELVVGIIGRLPFAFPCFQLVTLLSSGLCILELYHHHGDVCQESSSSPWWNTALTCHRCSGWWQEVFSLQPPFPLRVINDVSNPSFHEVASVYFEPASGHINT